MQDVTILGVSGSPRKNANTSRLVEKALEGAASVIGVKTEFYEMAGKEFHHCIADFKCYRTGKCVFEDDFQDFTKRFFKADGIIWGAPIYHMSIPANMKAALDRLGNALICNYLKRDKGMPRFSKVCGALVVGAARHGGQETTINFLLNSSILNNNFAVAGDTTLGGYIGAAATSFGVPGIEDMDRYDKLMSKDIILKDEKGVELAVNLGQRVAEMTRIVKAGISTLEKDLPKEYFYSWEELGWD